jgi:hypothetical protein
MYCSYRLKDASKILIPLRGTIKSPGLFPRSPGGAVVHSKRSNASGYYNSHKPLTVQKRELYPVLLDGLPSRGKRDAELRLGADHHRLNNRRIYRFFRMPFDDKICPGASGVIFLRYDKTF